MSNEAKLLKLFEAQGGTGVPGCVLHETQGCRCLIGILGDAQEVVGTAAYDRTAALLGIPHAYGVAQAHDDAIRSQSRVYRVRCGDPEYPAVIKDMARRLDELGVVLP